MQHKQRGPERGRVRAPAAIQTGFRLEWADGLHSHVTRLSRVLEATREPGNVELRQAYDGKLVASRRFGVWYDADGTPTSERPDFWTPGSCAHERQEYPRREGEVTAR